MSSEIRRIPNVAPEMQQASVLLTAADPVFPSGVVLTAGSDVTVNVVGQIATVAAGSGLLRQSNVFDSQAFDAAGTWTRPTGKTVTFLYGNNGGTLTLAATWLTSALAATVSVTTPVPGTNYRFNGVTVTTPQLLVLSL